MTEIEQDGLMPEMGCTHFSFSISMDKCFMSVSLKSKLRFSMLKLKFVPSGGRALADNGTGYGVKEKERGKTRSNELTELNKDQLTKIG